MPASADTPKWLTGSPHSLLDIWVPGFARAAYPQSIGPAVYRLVADKCADSTGTAEYNQRLSERRAQSVADYMKGLSVAASRITPRGFGETAPGGSVDRMGVG